MLQSFCLAFKWLIHLIVHGASLLFVLPLNHSPFNIRLVWWWLVLKLVTGASKVHKLVFVMCRVCWCITWKKKKSQTLNKGYKIKNMWWYWEQLEEHMGTYDYIWEHHMEQIENHLKLEEYIWEHLAYLQEFLKISKKSHQPYPLPQKRKTFWTCTSLATRNLNSGLYSVPHFTQVKMEGQTHEEQVGEKEDGWWVKVVKAFFFFFFWSM